MRKLLVFWVLCVISVISFVGCEQEQADSNVADVTEATYFYEQVRDDFLIDATVHGFSGDGTLAVYEATPRMLTQEQISDFIIANGDNVSEWRDTYDPLKVYGYTGITEAGGSFSHTLSPSALKPGGFSYSLPLYDRWKNCYIYYGQNIYYDSAKYLFAHLFMEPKDFAFATAKEAEETVRDRLSILGLDDLVLHRTLYIDHEILANEVTPILRTEEWQSSDKMGYIPTYDDWSENDDGYIFEFMVGIDSNPMIYEDIRMDTTSYTGSTILVCYQSAGVVMLSAGGSLWNIGTPVETVNNAISASEALATARIKLENTRGYSHTVVSDIIGKYAYIPDRDRVLLHPVWVVYAESTYELTGTTIQQYVIIDADTGDEIA